LSIILSAILSNDNEQRKQAES
jgi:hypothetical protein